MPVTVDLGFAEKLDFSNSYRLNSKFFPSKVGGKPAWLSLVNLPRGEQLVCSSCSSPLMFLIQLYAPIEGNLKAFHRTLYVFCCYASGCQAPSFRVFRSQLERLNKFYAFEPPSYNGSNGGASSSNNLLIYPESFGINTCNICGCYADKKCASCHRVSYCTKSHQILDWKDGGHRLVCKQEQQANGSNGFPSCAQPTNLLFPEFELVVEGEDADGDSSDESGDDDDRDGNLEDYRKMCEALRPKCQNENLDTYVDEFAEDQAFFRFHAMTKKNKDQVARYYRQGDKSDVLEPLWVSDQNQMRVQPPKCEYCGSDRKLEFQVMPQLLSLVGSNSNIDFGTLVVYACSASCDIAENYVKEFVWKQNYK